MHPVKTLGAVFATLVLPATLGCASTRTQEGTGQYVDDSVITTKVKAAIRRELAHCEPAAVTGCLQFVQA